MSEPKEGITIDEAIKKLALLSEGKFAGTLAEEEAAQKLGEEGLKREIQNRQANYHKPKVFLPGETKD